MMRPGHDQSIPFGLAAAFKARILKQRRRGAKQTLWSAAGIPQRGSHAALEALSTVESGVAAALCHRSPKSTQRAMILSIAT